MDLGRIFAEKFTKVFYSERIPFYGKVNETMIMYQLEALSIVLMRLSVVAMSYLYTGLHGGRRGIDSPIPGAQTCIPSIYIYPKSPCHAQCVTGR